MKLMSAVGGDSLRVVEMHVVGGGSSNSMGEDVRVRVGGRTRPHMLDDSGFDGTFVRNLSEESSESRQH